MKQGIIIIATQSPIYGRMAYNLAVTIKATGTKIPVAIVHDALSLQHLDEKQKGIFNELIPVHKNWNKIRFNIDKISPYDLTLQLDADMLWLWKDPELLFQQYKDVELLVTNEGYYDIEAGTETLTGNYAWLADLQETIKLYKLKGKFYQMRWELLFFKKTENVRKMFSLAEKIREKPKLKTWLFEGATVDEFCFAVAANQTGLDQQSAPFVAAHWLKRNFAPTIADINEKFFAISFGGNTANRLYKQTYDLVMKVACKKLGLQYIFPLQSKREHLTTRKQA